MFAPPTRSSFAPPPCHSFAFLTNHGLCIPLKPAVDLTILFGAFKFLVAAFYGHQRVIEKT